MNEIFEPFVQVERTLSRKRDGVGLGLAITKNLVELMGGKIWVREHPRPGHNLQLHDSRPRPSLASSWISEKWIAESLLKASQG